MSDRVTIDIDAGVADVRLNRPEKLNALDPAMFEGLIDAAAQLTRDRSVRAVVLSGNGPSFSAGLDFASFLAAGKDGPDLLHREPGSAVTLAQLAAHVWTELPVPVVAALHGVAYGGGLQIALGADLRFAASDTRVSVMEIKWGLIPDMSGTQTLRHLVRQDVAKELTYTGRVVDAAEAAQLGLVTRVVDEPLTVATETARAIAGKSPDAIREGKRLLNAAYRLRHDDALRLEADIQRTLLGSPNQMEAVTANLEKRAPAFEESKR